MNIVIRVIVGVAKFLYGYVVGDDLLLAVVMVVGLAASGILVAGGINAWWLVPALAVVMTGVNLLRHRPKAREIDGPAEAAGTSARQAY